MFLLGVTFFTLLTVLFTVLLIASRPSKHQKVVQTRLGQMGLGDRMEEKQNPEQLLKQTDDGQYAWFDDLLSRFRLYTPLHQLIEQANSKSRPGKVVLTSLALAIVSFAVVSMFVP